MKEKLNIGIKEPLSVIDLCHPFFLEDENRIKEFGMNGPFDLTIMDENFDVIYQGFRVVNDTERLKRLFDTYLKEYGYIPDTVPTFGDITVPSLGSEFSGKRLREWLKYSHPQKQDMWVNYFGNKSGLDGAWLDIIVTNRPDGIKNIKDDTMVAAFEKALVTRA
jgi:hypothetical protein